jgi:outer membrane protein with beta-barrel domain
LNPFVATSADQLGGFSLRTHHVIVAAVLCLSLATRASAQDEKGWVDVNFGIAQAAEDGYATSLSRTVFRETATFGAAYSFSRGASFDFGGGYMFSPVIGLGVNFQGTAHEDPPVLSIRIPHPNFFNAFASDTAIGDTALTRAEGSFNIQAMIVATPNSDRVRVRFFGGPSYFRVTQDTVDDIRYNQVFGILNTSNTVDITTYPFSEAEGTGWGFHGGADVGVFFTRIVGVGGFARFSRGKVHLSDFSGGYEVDAGGFQTGGGLRLKF